MALVSIIAVHKLTITMQIGHDVSGDCNMQTTNIDWQAWSKMVIRISGQNPSLSLRFNWIVAQLPIDIGFLTRSYRANTQCGCSLLSCPGPMQSCKKELLLWEGRDNNKNTVTQIRWYNMWHLVGAVSSTSHVYNNIKHHKNLTRTLLAKTDNKSFQLVSVHWAH